MARWGFARPPVPLTESQPRPPFPDREQRGSRPEGGDPTPRTASPRPEAPTLTSRRAALLFGATGAAAAAVVACTVDRSDQGLGVPTGREQRLTPTTLPQTVAQSTVGGGEFTLFPQTDLNFQTLFALGAIGQLTVGGEVAAVVAQANAAPGGASYQSVYDGFVSMGNKLQAAATTSLERRRRVTARSQFLRAARYYSQALYWVLGTSTPDAEAATYTALDDSYQAALELMDPAPERLDIRSGSHTLPAWIFRPSDDGAARPTIIINNGVDGQHVDLLAQGGFEALDRGYNVVIFEGPGQGSMLFLRNVPFRHDWEHVVTPIMDALVQRQDVDADRIALRGISFGGLLAPRAAAFEKRIAVLIADPGSTSTWLDFPAIVRNTADTGSAAEDNRLWQELIIPGSTPEQLFALKKNLEVFSSDAHDQVKAGGHPTDWASLSSEIKKFDLAGVAEKITCPTLVTQYEGDEDFGTEPTELYGMLRTRHKDMVRFTSVDGAQYHCGPMAPQVADEACWDWLDDTFGR